MVHWFLDVLFGNNSLGDALTQQFKRPMPTSYFFGDEPGDGDKRQKIDTTQVFSGPLCQTHVKSMDDISWQEKCEAFLQKSLKH